MITAKAIIPKGLLLDPRRLARTIENTLTEQAKAVKVDFNKTTRTWKNRPEFKITKARGVRVVSTDSEVYLFVTRGTKSHKITPKTARALTFKVGGFRPKTRPNWLGSNKGAPGKEWTSRQSVNHPGTAARRFEETIGEKWNKELPVQMQRAIDAEVDRAAKGRK